MSSIEVVQNKGSVVNRMNQGERQGVSPPSIITRRARKADALPLAKSHGHFQSVISNFKFQI
jgi:hypothetical protein